MTKKNRKTGGIKSEKCQRSKAYINDTMKWVKKNRAQYKKGS